MAMQVLTFRAIRTAHTANETLRGLRPVDTRYHAPNGHNAWVLQPSLEPPSLKARDSRAASAEADFPRRPLEVVRAPSTLAAAGVLTIEPPRNDHRAGRRHFGLLKARGFTHPRAGP